jgi:hypothetical protein
MGAFTFTSITTGVMEKLHLRSKKSNKKVSSLTISSPIEGSLQRQPSHMSNVLADFLPGVLLEGLPDYHVSFRATAFDRKRMLTLRFAKGGHPAR